MYQPQTREVCLLCNRSVLRIRRFTLTENLRNLHGHTVENIQAACPRQITFNNEEHICLRCWTRARRGRLPPQDPVGQPIMMPVLEPIVQDQPEQLEEAVVEPVGQDQPEELEGAVVEPIGQDQTEELEGAVVEPIGQDQPEELEGAVVEPIIRDQPESPVNIDQVRFNLTGYSRGPNSGNSCIFHGCQNATRHRIADSVKMKMFMEYNYYIPPNARICSEHLQTDSWEILLNAPNRHFEFNPQYMLDIIHLMKHYNNRLLNFENIEQFDEAELHYWTGRTRDEFLRILQETPSLLRKSHKPKTALGIYLAKIRTREADVRLASIFHMSRQNVEKLLKIVRQCLTEDFVPTHLGFDHISREEVAARNLTIPNTLFGSSDRSKAIIICDATYIFIQKSANFAFQKETYSPHKYRNLLKPFLIVTCDGYIIEVKGPYAATKNDASILRELLQSEEGVIPWYLNTDDVFILDRGFRDVVGEIESYGFRSVMPISNTGPRTQLTTAQANKSRLCTICRWPVEIVNGRFKRDYRIFRHNYFNKSMLHMFIDFRIAAALINAFHIPLVDNTYAEEFLEIINNRINTPNRLADYVENNNLNRQRTTFTNITGYLPNLPQFPELTEEDMILFSIGTYQLKLAASYYSEHVRGGDYSTEICAETQLTGLEEFGLPSSGSVWLLRAKIQSRHSSNKKYFCYVLVDGNREGRNSLTNYCCNCLTGRRTIGTCAHIMTVVWFLAWARHQDTIHRPALYMDTVVIDND